MKVELFIALRYLRAKRKGLFAFITSSIGVLGVTVGVAALITTLSVINGFQTDLKAKIIGGQAHVTINVGRSPAALERADAAARQDPDVVATAPYVLGQAILSSRGRSMGLVLKGLDPAREFSVNDLGKNLQEGSWEGLGGGDGPGIVLGRDLADNVGVRPGDEIVLISPKSVSTPLGMLPRMQKFRVKGLLHTGYYEYDATTAYTALSAASKFFGEDSVAGIGLRARDLDRAEAVKRRLLERLGPLALVRTFNDMNKPLFGALEFEKRMMFILVTLITLVASLNIASTLILRSVEKTRDVGLLKAMGATPRQIRRVFLAEGSMIGGFGVASGLALGLLLCWVIRHYSIVQLPAEVYFVSEVPVSVQAADVAAVAAMGLVLSLLATFYPAARAARIDPVEAIHYG